MESKVLFERYLQLLERVLRVRGGDPGAARRDYVWVEKPASGPQAVAMSPLLTGSAGDIEFPPGDII